ncbi:MAG: site-specific DNA-methyltransferase [Planctomycetes bacterium]|nr:site-specific DNA-methyltransferase [Planctomycetota bacterium]
MGTAEATTDATRTLDPEAAASFLAGVCDQRPVGGYTHNFYRYPARFSPLFARTVISGFSEPGDVIFDPFLGGATSVVEGRIAGRHVLGTDVSSLSPFLARVKGTALGEEDLARVVEWANGLSGCLNLHLPAVRDREWQRAGYQKGVPWPIRKTMEFVLARLVDLATDPQREFARCVLLRVGQWALDCRDRIPRAADFRSQLLDTLTELVAGMREYREAVEAHETRSRVVALQCPAAELPGRPELAELPARPKLVVTSPPYPGVYVLYHRWKVRGRKESPAPFWVAGCHDGMGQSYYCFGDRRHAELSDYFRGIRESFAAVRRVMDPGGLVVQLVAFKEPDWQLPRYLDAMREAGFRETMPADLGLPLGERLWRSVPGRRWFALIQGDLATAKELVLFHRPA